MGARPHCTSTTTPTQGKQAGGRTDGRTDGRADGRTGRMPSSLAGLWVGRSESKSIHAPSARHLHPSSRAAPKPTRAKQKIHTIPYPTMPYPTDRKLYLVYILRLSLSRARAKSQVPPPTRPTHHQTLTSARRPPQRTTPASPRWKS